MLSHHIKMPSPSILPLYKKKRQILRSDIVTYIGTILVQVTKIFDVGKGEIKARSTQVEESFRSTNRTSIFGAVRCLSRYNHLQIVTGQDRSI